MKITQFHNLTYDLPAKKNFFFSKFVCCPYLLRFFVQKVTSKKFARISTIQMKMYQEKICKQISVDWQGPQYHLFNDLNEKDKECLKKLFQL